MILNIFKREKLNISPEKMAEIRAREKREMEYLKYLLGVKQKLRFLQNMLTFIYFTAINGLYIFLFFLFLKIVIIDHKNYLLVEDYLVLIVLFPLYGSLCSGFLGFLIGRSGSFLLTTFFLSISMFLSYMAFMAVFFEKKVYYIYLFDWINSGLLHVEWGFYFDTITVIMLIVITTVSFLVHMYSCEYMKLDPHVPRFMSYLSLFTFFMLMLVTSQNFLQLFFGWEGVGLCSYLLIGFWYTRIQANKSAIKAMIVNRIGDFCLLIGIVFIYLFFKAVDYPTVFSLVPYFYNYKIMFLNHYIDYISIICFFLFIGAVGKSAQIGLHTWLPDAMEGPTPVSALIHAATMVTAGIFLIIRCSFIFEFAPDILVLVTIFGSITALFASSVGLVQNDIKKVIAYSTCSQLGYMTMACGLSGYTYALYHLANHAFFKALLFLGAGVIIHAISDEQDMRKMGALKEFMPITYVLMVLASFSLMGFPFFSGFYSKDVILELAYSHYTILGTFAYWIGIVSAFFTSIYSSRLIFNTFLEESNVVRLSYYLNARDPGRLMLFPLFVLAFGSLFFGFITKDLFIGVGNDFFQNSIFIHPVNYKLIDSEFIPTIYKLLPSIVSIVGVYLSISFQINYNAIFDDYMYKCPVYWPKYRKRKKFINGIIRALHRRNAVHHRVYNDFILRYWSIYVFLSKKWFFDYIYNYYIGESILFFSYKFTFELIDKGFIEMFGPEGLIRVLYKFSKIISRMHTGLIYQYTSISILISFLIVNFFIIFGLN